MNFIKFVAYILIFLFIFLNSAAISAANGILYRFPSVYNPSPIAGRIYLQPIGEHEDKVIDGLSMDTAVGTSAEYQYYFRADENDRSKEQLFNANSYIYTLKMSYGANIAFFPVEVGGIIRGHQDHDNTTLSAFLEDYHEFTEKTLDWGGFIPPDGLYNGNIGDGNVSVIGEDNEIYLNTVQLYTKFQLLEEHGLYSDTPNLSVKLSVRIPNSSKEFDTAGVGISSGISKQISPHWRLIGAAGIIYQDLEKKDFNSTDLKIKKGAFDLFGGVAWDMFKLGGLYASGGIRYSSERVRYEGNSESGEGSVVFHFGVNYIKKLSRGRVWDLFLNVNENFPALGHGLEPDIRGQLGASYIFGGDS